MLAPPTRPAGRVLLLVIAAGLVAPSARAAEPPAWRTDYNAARKEAQEKGLPLLVVVGTEQCFYCKKLDATTLRDAGVSSAVAGGFVPLKVDARANPELARALKVQVYPTTVLAGPDGKIHAFIEGFLEPDRFAEHLKRAANATATADWMARDYQEAGKAVGAGDYPRAVSLLKGVIRDAEDRPVGAKAREVLEGVERQAAGRLVRARELEAKGFTPEAMDTLADLMKTYAGTQAAADAATRLAGLAEQPEAADRLKARQARDLLALAKEEFRAGRYYDCLQRCDHLSAAFADRAEGKDGVALAGEIKNNPDRLAAACEQMNERTAALYLTLAESWAKKGQTAEATACLDKVMKLCPNSRQAEVAQAQLTKIQGRNPATPAGFKKQ
ncbi:MAG: thioredoxin family protein [Gemmataceae bacterium]|nr:thioredoxin family protein [Gemmataceae bacterium]